MNKNILNIITQTPAEDLFLLVDPIKMLGCIENVEMTNQLSELGCRAVLECVYQLLDCAYESAIVKFMSRCNQLDFQQICISSLNQSKKHNAYSGHKKVIYFLSISLLSRANMQGFGPDTKKSAEIFIQKLKECKLLKMFDVEQFFKSLQNHLSFINVHPDNVHNIVDYSHFILTHLRIKKSKYELCVDLLETCLCQTVQHHDIGYQQKAFEHFESVFKKPKTDIRQRMAQRFLSDYVTYDKWLEELIFFDCLDYNLNFADDKTRQSILKRLRHRSYYEKSIAVFYKGSCQPITGIARLAYLDQHQLLATYYPGQKPFSDFKDFKDFFILKLSHKIITNSVLMEKRDKIVKKIEKNLLDIELSLSYTQKKVNKL